MVIALPLLVRGTVHSQEKNKLVILRQNWANVVLSPFVMKVALKYLPALRGGIALVATFVALLVTVLFTNGLTVASVSTWVLAPFIIWAVTVVAGVVLPMLLFKKALQSSGGDVAKE